MQKELEDLQPQLVKTAKENSEMMIVIEKESAEVEITTGKVRAEEAIVNEQAAQSQALKDECEAELAEAIPALEAAIAALNTLKVLTSFVQILFPLRGERLSNLVDFLRELSPMLGWIFFFFFLRY